MNRALRILAAIIAGYVTIALLVILGTGASAMLLAPTPTAPGSGYLAANLTISFIAAIAGGAVAALVARLDALLAAAILAVMVLLFGLLLEGRPGQPTWYQSAIPWIGALGVALGGWLLDRRRQRRSV